ncbi:MAG: hydrogenase maturation nickel metallochaperone HypA [Oscillospiraceae bacterium]|jgi:hydrogenase nickel incorporation protein HypA/HybF|nr:hydrogenase maturation nickel metallochaperone HypA [Oscillospiraceae bacterium]
MHEYPAVVEIINKASEHSKGKFVKEINLVIGDLCGFVASSVELYFPIIAEGTCCEKAVLNIERIKPKLKCNKCGELFQRKMFSFNCKCGGEGLLTEIGTEFFIKSIEVD